MRTGRVRSRRSFAVLRERGVRARHGDLRLTFAAGGERPDVAYAIGRPVGTAVARNRLRRRLRAVVDTVELAPGTYLISASPAAAGATSTTLRADLVAALAHLDTPTAPRVPG